jgi:hypothetical protein
VKEGGNEERVEGWGVGLGGWGRGDKLPNRYAIFTGGNREPTSTGGNSEPTWPDVGSRLPPVKIAYRFGSLS